MESFGLYIGTALALMFVIEGLFYALFTEQARRMMGVALSQPPQILRGAGMAMAGLGLLVLGLLSSFAGG